MGQMGFFDIKNDPLVKIDEAVPWEDFRPPLETRWRLRPKERKSKTGRKRRLGGKAFAGGGIELLGHRDEGGAGRIEAVDQFGEVGERLCQAIAERAAWPAGCDRARPESRRWPARRAGRRRRPIGAP